MEVYKTVVIFYCFVSVWAVPIKNSSRILNGERASPGQFPWQAAALLNGVNTIIMCSGTIISEEWILTTGRCIEHASIALVFTGVLDLLNATLPGEVQPTKFILHEDYDNKTLANNIGLIKLSIPLVFNDDIKAIGLADDKLDDNVDITVSGYGLLDKSDTEELYLLHYITISTITKKKCEKSYGEGAITEDMICAASSDQIFRSPCSGDEGGPVVVNASNNPKLVAIFSTSNDLLCVSTDYPSVYTRISYYREWIRSKTGV